MDVSDERHIYCKILYMLRKLRILNKVTEIFCENICYCSLASVLNSRKNSPAVKICSEITVHFSEINILPACRINHSGNFSINKRTDKCYNSRSYPNNNKQFRGAELLCH